MLDRYSTKTDEENNRVEVVKAALDIAKASVGSYDAAAACKTDTEMQYVAQQIKALADAIEDALKVS
ncbi:TPA: hypothetical protein I8235_003276 [Kluyvera intermedia]|uniref:Uncharacterized protein n=1 Tax=Phytobacter ursingii TaxID=1972431 RepID=A0AAC8TMI9_9ENTR|nr:MULTISPECIES: hypothetical protein [Enterobacteriaceae]MDU6684841.1 hypothetical protein [Enterobacteriaceae bacterium]HAT2208064.1 hypothetical protein [Kluyvera intermedia]AKL12624.1 hypothetical protein AB182_15525 [Phytobacter ursingii]MCL9671593.1 hypothetical protein [Citrobacter sp. MNAZ 1397]HAT2518779.1 hypothetical protein [Kluyvera intermedia]